MRTLKISWFLLGAAILALSFSPVLGSRAQTPAPAGKPAGPALTAAQKDLLTAEKDFDEAYKNRDQQVMEKMTAEDATFIDDTGLSNKRRFIDTAVKSTRIEYYTLSDTTARAFGETGIVNGRWIAKYTVDGKDVSGVFLFTDVFVKKQGRWMVVASQTTRIAK